MNYKKNYNDYISYVKTLNRKKGNGMYYEKHHIIPKSLGGDNSPNNLVLLTAREHFLAHYLLTKIYNDSESHYKMVCAFNLLLSFEKRSTLQLEERTKAFNNSKFYSFLKEKYCKEISLLRKGRKLNRPRKKVEKRYWIFNEKYSKDKMVLLEEIPFYLENGWKRGRFFQKKSKTLPKIVGRIRVYNPSNDSEKSIYTEELNKYLLEGWVRGRRPVSEETKEKHKRTINNKDSKAYAYIQKIKNGLVEYTKPTLGKKVLNKNGKFIYVELEKIDDYINDGWSLGGPPKSSEWKEEMSKKMLGNTNGHKKKEV